MKNKQLQGIVTKNVQDTFVEFPTFESVPEMKEVPDGSTSVEVEEPVNETNYIRALYELFHLQPQLNLVGRAGRRIVAGE